jgi:hypothetical protein
MGVSNYHHMDFLKSARKQKSLSETEKRMLNANEGGLPHSTGLSDAIANTVLQVC